MFKFSNYNRQLVLVKSVVSLKTLNLYNINPEINHRFTPIDAHYLLGDIVIIPVKQKKAELNLRLCLLLSSCQNRLDLLI